MKLIGKQISLKNIKWPLKSDKIQYFVNYVGLGRTLSDKIELKSNIESDCPRYSDQKISHYSNHLHTYLLVTKII